MRPSLKRIVLLILLSIVGFLSVLVTRNWDTIQRAFLGVPKVYEIIGPAMPANIRRPIILVFFNTNGFRHESGIPQANALFARVSKWNDLYRFQPGSIAAFNREILARFDAVVFDSVSGDIFTFSQQKALNTFLEHGAALVIHAAGGKISNDWRYSDRAIGVNLLVTR